MTTSITPSPTPTRPGPAGTWARGARRSLCTPTITTSWSSSNPIRSAPTNRPAAARSGPAGASPSRRSPPRLWAMESSSPAATPWPAAAPASPPSNSILPADFGELPVEPRHHRHSSPLANQPAQGMRRLRRHRRRPRLPDHPVRLRRLPRPADRPETLGKTPPRPRHPRRLLVLDRRGSTVFDEFSSSRAHRSPPTKHYSSPTNPAKSSSWPPPCPPSPSWPPTRSPKKPPAPPRPSPTASFFSAPTRRSGASGQRARAKRLENAERVPRTCREDLDANQVVR